VLWAVLPLSPTHSPGSRGGGGGHPPPPPHRARGAVDNLQWGCNRSLRWKGGRSLRVLSTEGALTGGPGAPVRRTHVQYCFVCVGFVWKMALFRLIPSPRPLPFTAPRPARPQVPAAISGKRRRRDEWPRRSALGVEPLGLARPRSTRGWRTAPWAWERQ